MTNADLIFDLLNINKDVPLSELTMAQKLRATFYPPHETSPRLNSFMNKLKTSLIDLGVNVMPYDQAIDKESGKIKSGIVIFSQGNGEDDEIAIRKVSSLYHNPVVNVFEGAPPIPENPTLQETLDSIVGVLAWHLSHVPIFVEENKWTFCTMNGAVIECGDWQDPTSDILHSLIPKLAAQVMPPARENIHYREKIFDPVKQGFGDFIEDFMSAANVWRSNGLMLAHTSIEDLDYRNRFYKRIVSQYLDHRTGMSYGFMVKQLPVKSEKATRWENTPDHIKQAGWGNRNTVKMNDEHYIKIDLFDDTWVINLPDTWLLSTRSGCNKTNLKPDKDILKLGLRNGQITIDTPEALSAEDCRPSYDTYAILAHAVGNVIAASLLRSINPDSPFPHTLENDGLSISHWHGYPDPEFPSDGYFRHGENNPPVSCSTPQSAAYAFIGKLKALEKNRDSLDNYRGGIHVEPHHGTNISGSMTITETAKWVDAMHKNRLKKAEALK